MKELLPKYFSSQWSFANFKVSEAKCIVSFGQEKNTIIAVCSNGTYFKYSFDPLKGGECVRESFHNILWDNDLK